MSQAQVIDLSSYRAQRGAPEPWVRYPQVAEEFGVSERTVQRWVTEGTKNPPRPPLEQVEGATRKVSRRLRLLRLGRIDAWLGSGAA